MAKRISVALATVLVSMFLTFPALSQPAKDAAPASTDLGARVKAVQANPAQFEASYKLGSKAAAVCAFCHGDNGNSVKSDIPNLAGQNPAYLLEQMRQFNAGERRYEFMEGLIKALKPEDKIGVAVFFANQEVQTKPAANAALADKGKAYYVKNCLACHGEQGRGSEGFARIAGQQPGYLTLTLKRYRDGSSVRKGSVMAPSAKTMTDDDIATVTAYISSMK